MPLLDWLNGEIEYVVTGNGPPVTVFAHGLAGSIPETRPFGSGVDGTRVFLHFRGHGASSAPVGTCTYAALADELVRWLITSEHRAPWASRWVPGR